METFKHLNNVINNRSAFVPVNLVKSVIAAAAALGVHYHKMKENPKGAAGSMRITSIFIACSRNICQ